MTNFVLIYSGGSGMGMSEDERQQLVGLLEKLAHSISSAKEKEKD